MDIVTFALCKKLASQGGGGTSAEVQQQINEIKTMITQLETGQEEYDAKLTSIEGKVNEVQTDTILAELRDVREQLSLKVSARIVE